MALTDDSESNNNAKWSDVLKLILAELERLHDGQDKLDIRVTLTREKDIPEIHTKIAKLETRSAIWGAVAGIIFSAITYAAFSYLIQGPNSDTPGPLIKQGQSR